MKEKKFIKKSNMKRNIIFLFLLVVLIVILVYIYNLIRGLDSVSYKDYDLYQYFSNVKTSYTGELTISKRKGITNLKSKDAKIIMDSTPVYFQEENLKTLFPENMSLIMLNEGKSIYQIKHFTIIKSDGNEANLIINDNTKHLDRCFIYDGEDLYFFPYEISLKLDEEVINLSPMSYVRVLYKDQVEIYNHLEDKYMLIETHTNDLLATINDITINLDTDMIITAGGTRLLTKNFNNLPYYE